ncbi:MAG: protein kinase [Chloroflexi bacterium]|nr:protein kinase [Chloroflexota bacterium]
MAEWIGKTIGKVRIEKYLAHGGMAEVYMGTHLTLDRPVAVKIMHRYIESDPELLERFQREAKAVAGLRHPNIVQIYDFDTHEGHPYIVMEYLKGPSLANYLRDLHKNGTQLSLAQIAQLLKPLAAGIDYAHSQGIVHRDIKPANIILNNKSGNFSFDQPLRPDTECIITDFGLVRMTSSTTKTLSGVISGTPAYMSPEQAQGNPADGRSDTYSLGVVLYEMMAGRVPFDGDSTLGVILKHVSEPPPPINNISPEIQAVVYKALEKLPENRYQTAHDLLLDFYNAVDMHAEAETLHSLRFKTPPSTVSVSKKPTPRPNKLLWIGAGIFTCLCIGVFTASALGVSAFAALPGLTNTTETTPPATTAAATATAPHGDQHSSETESDSAPPPQVNFGDFVGILRFQGNLDQVTVTASLPDPTYGAQYEAWLINDSAETLTSLGLLQKNNSGQYTLTYLDPESRNLLDGFNRMEITLETLPDPSPNPSDTISYSSGLPSGALTHIRHLLVSFGSTPNQIGLTEGLVETSQLVANHGEQLEQAFLSGDEETVRAHAEAIINLIVGKQSGDIKDWDKDGKINNPGDGFGLLLNGDQVGYVEGMITHAELAASSADATANVKVHSGHVGISGRNIEGWAAQLREVAKRIVEAGSGQIAETDVRLAVSLAQQIYKGIDLDGNESVDPVEGEGGALTAYEHAEYMADMQILEGANQIPPPGP